MSGLPGEVTIFNKICSPAKGKNVCGLTLDLYMEANQKYSIPLFISDKDEEIKKAFNNLKDENQRLQLENEQLKRELERERFLHKALYNEWKELTSGAVKKSGSGKVKRLVRK